MWLTPMAVIPVALTPAGDMGFSGQAWEMPQSAAPAVTRECGNTFSSIRWALVLLYILHILVSLLYWKLWFEVLEHKGGPS